MRPGDVVLFPLLFDNAKQGRFEREKFLVCVRAPRSFFLINTKPPRHRGAAVAVGPEDLPFLNHVSFVDTGALIEIDADAVQSWLEAEPRRLRGAIPPLVRDRIREAVATSGLLPRAQVRLILASLI
jgi:hypothetical protein